jgi:hypothetical protein
MKKPRTVLPTDLLALVSYDGRVYPNEAKPRERIGAEQPKTFPIETAFEQWFSFATGRHAWISASGKRLNGLVSARRRGTRQAWEIDCLIETTDTQDGILGLLECATTEAGRNQAEKLFLRLNADSDLLEAVRRAGFVPYLEELLLVGEVAPTQSPPALALRPISRQDAYPLFRLYNAVTPEPARRYEAVTYAEWQAAQERDWLKHATQLVLEREGRLSGWVAAAQLGQGLSVDLLLEPAEVDQAPALVAEACRQAGARGHTFILLPEAAGALIGRLGAAGFEEVDRFVRLACRTVQPARLRKLLPAVVKPAI